ncbi:hypothetical protein GLOTRDRAFT_96371 [Gloeophyllum trabeum ATCC 11539]|uniref:C2H2-type domain-containing protein n=1 Tax=Gloeophyllum trabeum (strain ATCC 11539 / FP-39264 / Madison 617) TaxID=670483 RepID=S7RGI0_GLOTA|nr:uncharacterized protein GLOTRDRAFT_96371 [Gloeophyllum trabeum ATCC 11539]EPQ51659.1 hypothetical protein GLOTRDRAFT_96371 [Gloeophyllum trabeum ATCC 11539]
MAAMPLPATTFEVTYTIPGPELFVSEQEDTRQYWEPSSPDIPGRLDEYNNGLAGSDFDIDHEEPDEGLHRDAIVNGVALRDISPLSCTPVDDGGYDHTHGNYETNKLADPLNENEGNLSNDCDGHERRLDEHGADETDLKVRYSDEEDEVERVEIDQTGPSVVERPSRRVTRSQLLQKRANKGVNPALVNVEEDRHNSAALGTRYRARGVQQGRVTSSREQAPISNGGGARQRKRKSAPRDASDTVESGNHTDFSRISKRQRRGDESTPETVTAAPLTQGDSSQRTLVRCLWNGCGTWMPQDEDDIVAHFQLHVPKGDKKDLLPCQWEHECNPHKGETGHRRIQRGNMVRHLLGHPEIQKVLVHKCPHCPSRFSRRDQVIRHWGVAPDCASKEAEAEAKQSGRN